MWKLVFDIETVWEDFSQIDEITKEVLTRSLKKESNNEEDYIKSLEMIKNWLGFSPLTGQIVTIWVYDIEKNKWTIYYQAPNTETPNFEENNFKYKALTEKEMIEKFWEWAKNYNEFISFNWRSFDVPFLLLRWAIHWIKASKDLMANKYTNYQKIENKHIDLLDQLSFYWAVRRRWSLHLYCRAFGIKSPKWDWISWDDVSLLFKQGQYLDIAKYNSWDLLATAQLYDCWNKYLRLA